MNPYWGTWGGLALDPRAEWSGFGVRNSSMAHILELVAVGWVVILHN